MLDPMLDLCLCCVLNVNVPIVCPTYIIFCKIMYLDNYLLEIIRSGLIVTLDVMPSS